jgi:hypothetical protein
MILRNMRSILFLFLAFLIIAGPATAADIVHVSRTVSEKELQNVMCSDTSYPGLPEGTYIAVVYLSGHGNTFIDTQALTPIGYEMVGGNDTAWYTSSPGDHTVMIASPGYINLIAHILVCSGKSTIVYYDQETHLIAGTTKKPTTEQTATVLSTTPWAGQSADFKAALAAAGTTPPGGGLGTISITTEPSGAVIFIDGVQRGISPVTVPDLTPGTHTLLLKLGGYQDLSVPVTISAGRTQSFSSAMLKSSEVPSVTYVTASTTTATTTRSSGFEAVAVVGAMGLLLFIRKTIP